MPSHKPCLKFRRPWLAAILSLAIPFYTIYWLYDTAQRLRQDKLPAPPDWLLVLGPAGLSLVAAMLTFSGQLARQTIDADSRLSSFAAVFIIASLFYYHRLGLVLEGLSKEASTRWLIMGLLMVVPPAGVYWGQRILNQYSQPPA